jgi:hypothetical protein
MDDEFVTNLLRSILANSHLQTTMMISRDMYGKGYFSLSPVEKGVVDQIALSHVAANHNALTRDFFGQPERQAAGFGIPKAEKPNSE